MAFQIGPAISGKSNLLAFLFGIISPPLHLPSSLTAFTLTNITWGHTLDVVFYASIAGTTSLFVKVIVEWFFKKVGLIKPKGT